MSPKNLERILCAAIYVNDGKEYSRTSHNYPTTGLLFCGLRHSDCFTSLHAWADRLTDREKQTIHDIQKHQLRGINQGFLTSSGRYVNREEGYQLAVEAGQIPAKTLWADGSSPILFSEDLY